MTDTRSPDTRPYVPALGRPELTGLYDHVVALVSRERVWRAALLAQVAPRPGETILDVGCGTGAFAVMLKTACPGARIIGVDPDPAILALAAAKALKAGVEIEWRQAMGDRLADVAPAGSADKVVSSLVLHQCPLPMKQAILDAMHTALKPGGAMGVADYGLQRTALMRLLFRTVQMTDGFALTEPNAKGVLPSLMAQAGFAAIEERRVIPTPTGSISLHTASRPPEP
ncbi:class I SAM-dependent methyltransferase [Caulobacter soli]|uniref:class I SAM-dependent methyltransferase n=1 Tax=Caulobacter soli TaxID=2708539 RepID=UPI0013ECE0D4|nr:class I SAM-dependent methyltransferase [Caulobacter soli]